MSSPPSRAFSRRHAFWCSVTGFEPAVTCIFPVVTCIKPVVKRIKPAVTRFEPPSRAFFSLSRAFSPLSRAFSPLSSALLPLSRTFLPLSCVLVLRHAHFSRCQAHRASVTCIFPAVKRIFSVVTRFGPPSRDLGLRQAFCASVITDEDPLVCYTATIFRVKDVNLNDL
jgi:hypothetical protein